MGFSGRLPSGRCEAPAAAHCGSVLPVSTRLRNVLLSGFGNAHEKKRVTYFFIRLFDDLLEHLGEEIDHILIFKYLRRRARR